MSIKKIFGWILKTPLILLVFATAGIGFYAASGAIDGFRISYNAPIALSVVIGLYLVGAILCLGNSSNEPVQQDESYSMTDEETQRAIEQYEANN